MLAKKPLAVICPVLGAADGDTALQFAGGFQMFPDVWKQVEANQAGPVKETWSEKIQDELLIYLELMFWFRKLILLKLLTYGFFLFFFLRLWDLFIIHLLKQD